MLLAYVDESGDSGYSGSRTYTLGCQVLPAATWPDAFDATIGFRRFVRTSFGIKVRDELKANNLVRGTGPCFGLGDSQRRAIFRQQMRLAAKVGARVFAVVIRKELIKKQTMNPRDIAWEFLLQRLERLSAADDMPVLIFHDEGEELAIRKLARKARRAGYAGSRFGTGTLSVPFRMLIDDPVPRNSSHSYMIQGADLAAYAAFRRLYPPPPKREAVCPPTMWDSLGSATYERANELVRTTGVDDPPGIVVWPR